MSLCIAQNRTTNEHFDDPHDTLIFMTPTVDYTYKIVSFTYIVLRFGDENRDENNIHLFRNFRRIIIFCFPH